MSAPFDRALRAAARRGRDAGVCPDAAILAAYADNGLSPAEREQVEAHSADCASCLQHLALLGAVSVERGDPAEPARSWLGRWGWLVPVATAVLVVAVWIRMPERQTAVEVERDEQVRQAPSPVEGLKDEVPGLSSPDRIEPAPRLQGRFAEPKAGAEQPGTARRSDEAGQKSAASPGPPPRPAGKVAATSPAEGAASQAGARAQADLRLLGQAAPTAAGAPAAPPPAPAAAPQAATAAPPPAASDALKEEVVVTRERETSLRRSVAAAPATLTATASATESYRASGRRIERSADGGATWTVVLADAGLTVTAAACSPGGPCWFGGAGGEVLRRTADGFARSALPVRLPVVAIAASPGPSAVVTVQGGTRYRTTDGTTWIQNP
jgi:hypothetical protein